MRFVLHDRLYEAKGDGLFREIFESSFQTVAGPTAGEHASRWVVGRRVERAPTVLMIELVQRWFEETRDESLVSFGRILQSNGQHVGPVETGGGSCVFGPVNGVLVVGCQGEVLLPV